MNLVCSKRFEQFGKSNWMVFNEILDIQSLIRQCFGYPLFAQVGNYLLPVSNYINFFSILFSGKGERSERGNALTFQDGI